MMTFLESTGNISIEEGKAEGIFFNSLLATFNLGNFASFLVT